MICFATMKYTFDKFREIILVLPSLAHLTEVAGCNYKVWQVYQKEGNSIIARVSRYSLQAFNFICRANFLRLSKFCIIIFNQPCFCVYRCVYAVKILISLFLCKGSVHEDVFSFFYGE